MFLMYAVPQINLSYIASEGVMLKNVAKLVGGFTKGRQVKSFKKALLLHGMKAVDR